ncbi:MAG: GNAT family N-acetyltransferase [Thermoplasmata archaeon]
MAAQGNSERGDERAVPAAAKPGNVSRPAIVVERLTHQDIPQICALYKRVWDSFRPDLPAELVKEWEPTPLEFTSWMEGVTYFAARRDGKMVGAIGCEIAEGSCRLLHLAVDPEARRQGIATSLANAAVEWARHSNTASVWADALSRFTAAAQLFKKLGYTECGILHKHYWNEDVRLFEKLL